MRKYKRQLIKGQHKWSGRGRYGESKYLNKVWDALMVKKYGEFVRSRNAGPNRKRYISDDCIRTF